MFPFFLYLILLSSFYPAFFFLLSVSLLSLLDSSFFNLFSLLSLLHSSFFYLLPLLSPAFFFLPSVSLLSLLHFSFFSLLSQMHSSFFSLFSLLFVPFTSRPAPLFPTERFQMVMLNSTVNTLDVCEVCGSYQCPYCPIYSSAPSLNLPNVGFLISVALVTYAYQVFSESRSFAGSRWPGGSGSGGVWWEYSVWILNRRHNECVCDFFGPFCCVENRNLWIFRFSFPLMEIMLDNRLIQALSGFRTWFKSEISSRKTLWVSVLIL